MSDVGAKLSRLCAMVRGRSSIVQMIGMDRMPYGTFIRPLWMRTSLEWATATAAATSRVSTRSTRLSVCVCATKHCWDNAKAPQTDSEQTSGAGEKNRNNKISNENETFAEDAENINKTIILL